MTKQNLKNLSLQAKVVTGDVCKLLSKNWERFDLILLDPPYQSQLYTPVLKQIAKFDLLNDDGIIVCEHFKSGEFDYKPFKVIDEKRYGTIMLTFLQKDE